MDLDNVVKNAIKEACESEGSSDCASPIIKLIERFSSNQIVNRIDKYLPTPLKMLLLREYIVYFSENSFFLNNN